jgi:hypothetical protein
MFATAPLNYRHMIMRNAKHRMTGYVTPPNFGSNSGGASGSNSNRAGAAPPKGWGHFDNVVPMGPVSRFARNNANVRMAQAVLRKPGPKVRRRATPRLDFPTFYSRLARAPTMSRVRVTAEPPLSRRQKREVARRRNLRRNVFGSASSGSNTNTVAKVRRNMPEPRRTKSLPGTPSNSSLSPRRAQVQRTGISNQAVRTRLANMLYQMNNKVMLKMSSKNLRVALANKMGVNAKNLPLKVISSQIKEYLHANPKTGGMRFKIGAERRAMRKIASYPRRTAPVRGENMMFRSRGKLLSIVKPAVSKAPVRLVSGSNTNGSSGSRSSGGYSS